MFVGAFQSIPLTYSYNFSFVGRQQQFNFTQCQVSCTDMRAVCVDLAHYKHVYLHARLFRHADEKNRATLAKEHAEGQVCVTTDMFRSNVSRRRPLSSTISPVCVSVSVCLPWNAATDNVSSLEQQGIIWKGWQNQHTVCRLSPCYFGSFGSVVCSEHQRPVGDIGLKGGDAQFNQTFGRLCV